MAYEVILDQKALDDLRAIVEYYDGTVHLKNFRNRLYRRMKSLETLPNIGKEVDGFRKIVILKRYIVLYRIAEDKVIIRRIYDGRTDYKLNEEGK